MKDNNWENKEQRAATALEHTKLMEKKYHNEIVESFKLSQIFGTGFIVIGDRKFYPLNLELKDTDTVSAIFDLPEDAGNVAILNFSSYKNPGGMFIKGSKAQEECLCHESNLYNILYQFENNFYSKNRKDLNKSLYKNRAIYTPNVIFERNNQVKKASVITCAAPNKKAAQKYCNVSDIENSLHLAIRIKFILDIAKHNLVDTLILGAYGCGVFGQNPKEVAWQFKKILQLYNFKKVIFAIPSGNGNLEAFKEIFKAKEEL